MGNSQQQENQSKLTLYHLHWGHSQPYFLILYHHLDIRQHLHRWLGTKKKEIKPRRATQICFWFIEALDATPKRSHRVYSSKSISSLCMAWLYMAASSLRMIGFVEASIPLSDELTVDSGTAINKGLTVGTSATISQTLIIDGVPTCQNLTVSAGITTSQWCKHPWNHLALFSYSVYKIGICIQVALRAWFILDRFRCNIGRF